MPFFIVRQDITKMKVDAIVNAANTELLMGGGVCGAIFAAAGARKLQEACNRVSPIQTGGAAITPGFSLPAKYIIHAAGPVYDHRRREQCAARLRSAYTESLKLAVENQCESIAFPLISSGIYGYPKAEALQEATTAIREFLNGHDMDVYLAVFDKASFVVSEQLMGSVKSYIDEHYIRSHDFGRRQLLDAEARSLAEADAAVYKAMPPEVKATRPAAAPSRNIRETRQAESAPRAAGVPLQNMREAGQTENAPRAAGVPLRNMRQAGQAVNAPRAAGIPLEDLVENLDEPFSDTLLKLIDRKGKTDAEVYKKANIDRRLFSKIRSVKGYTPKKHTILALAIALELTLSETDDLLERAGYALSHSSKFDVIVEYFIVSGKYDIFNINEVLFQYDQPLLGG